MASLEFRIGGLDIRPELFNLGPQGINPLHRFIVAAKDRTASIYIACTVELDRAELRSLIAGESCGISYDFPKYVYVAERFGLQKKQGHMMVGGGMVYTRDGDLLVFKGIAGDYGGSISNEAAREFGLVLLPELEKRGIKLREILPEMKKWESCYLNRFWKEGKVGA